MSRSLKRNVDQQFIKQAAWAVIALAPVLFLFSCQSKEVTAAKIYINSLNWEKARDQLEQAVEAYPNNAEAHFLLGQVYGELDRFKDMNQEFDASLEHSNKFEQEILAERERHWIDRYDAGIKAIDAGDLQAAEEAFKLAILIRPDKLDAYQHLALAYTKAGQFNQSVTIYENLLEKDSTNLDILFSLGNLYYSLNRFDLAIEYLNKVLAIEPDHQDALANLALSYDSEGDVQKAADAFERAIAANPKDKDLIFLYGSHQFKKKNYPEAIRLFEQVLAMNPEDFEAIVNVANSYLSMAENEKAQLKKTQLDDLSPVELHKIKENSILNYQNAIPYLEHALQLQPNHPKLWLNLGVAYINTGKKEKGEKALLRSEELKVHLLN